MLDLQLSVCRLSVELVLAPDNSSAAMMASAS